MIVQTKKESYKVGNSTSLILPEEIAIMVEKYFSPPKGYKEAIKHELAREYSDEEIEAALSELAVLVLESDTRCNMACSYCVYSGHYQYYRPHGDKKMSLQTARKAVDFYYKHIKSPYQNDRKPRMLISYYGGESLLEVDTLMKSVEYANKHRYAERVDLNFSVSTNGVLLTPGAVKKLVENKISATVSLDGPETEHDRFRVLKNGKGTFKKIMENVMYIKREYPDYFDDRVRFIITLHPFHDLKKIEAFFLSRKDLFNADNVRINDLKSASLTNTQWAEARKNMYMRKKTQLKKDRWFYKKMFIDPIEQAVGEGKTLFLTKMKNFTRSCFPGGEKLFIDPEGNFHICEKINRYFPIGNLEQGFDIQKIKSIFKQWRKKTLELECWKCLNLYFCPFCYASAGVDGDFLIKKADCRKLENYLSEKVYHYLSIKEEEDEKIDSNHDLDLPGFLDSL